jgi:beta-aspartyl-peptidase (threonine type)
MGKAAIIVHGGAGYIRDELWPSYQSGTQAAARAGQALLDTGASALDAVVAAVIELENNPTFNAGTGSSLNAAGEPQCDAFLMTDELLSGAVGALTGVRNPILVARAVYSDTPHEFIAAAGALELARRSGIELCDPSELIVERRLQQWKDLTARGESFEKTMVLESAEEPMERVSSDPQEFTPEQADTVGACAIDQHGRIAVASSTGGIMLKLPGRIGDTPVIGSGSYAGPAGAVTATGHGEACMRICLAKYIYDQLERGATALEAARAGVQHMVEKVDGKAGVIVLDHLGNRAWSTSTSRISAGAPEQLLDAAEGSL